MKWEVEDATKMSFEDNKFDIVIDKGTYDALACADDKTMSANLIKEMIRVLKPNGFCYEISSGDVSVIKERFDTILESV